MTDKAILESVQVLKLWKALRF